MKTIEKKTVLLGSKASDPRRAVFKMYEDALTQAFGAEYTDPALRASEERLRQRWWSVLIAPIIKACPFNIEMTDAILQEYNLDMSHQSEIVLEGFQDFINDIIIEDYGSLKEAAKKIADDTIDDPYILAMHLSKRMVTIALSNSLIPQHDGLKIMQAFEIFVGKINKERLLATDQIFQCFRDSKALSNYELQCVKNKMNNWHKCIQSQIKITKSLNENLCTLSLNKDMLKNLDHRLTIRIISVLSPNVTTAEVLHDEIKNRTLGISENHYLDLLKKSSVKNIQERRKLVILSYTKSDAKEIGNQQLLNKLYVLKENTQKLLDVIGQLEQLTAVLGWIPIMFGMLNLTELSKKLLEHFYQCEDALEIHETDSLLMNGPKPILGAILAALSQIPSLNFIHEQHPAVALNHLMSPKILANLEKTVKNSIESLYKLQEEMDIKLMDEEKTNVFYKMMGKNLKFSKKQEEKYPSPQKGNSVLFEIAITNPFYSIDIFLSQKKDDKNGRKENFKAICQALKAVSDEKDIRSCINKMLPTHTSFQGSHYIDLFKKLLKLEDSEIQRTFSDFCDYKEGNLHAPVKEWEEFPDIDLDNIASPPTKAQPCLVKEKFKPEPLTDKEIEKQKIQKKSAHQATRQLAGKRHRFLGGESSRNGVSLNDMSY